MLFSSITFLFMFLPVTVLIYYLVPQKKRNIVLLIASLFFYAGGRAGICCFDDLIDLAEFLLQERYR